MVVLAGGWGCAVPDRPPHLPPPLPPAVERVIPDAEVRTLSLGPGVSYAGLFQAATPWAVHVIAVDLGRCEVGLRVVTGGEGEEVEGRQRVTELLAGAGGGVVAGVNGDFFTPEGLTVGTEVVAGTVRRVRPRPAMAWRPGAMPWLGVPVVEGDTLIRLGWPLSVTKPDGETYVVGGFPLLLREGRRVGDLEVAELPGFAASRHPRTAVGFDPASRRLWVVVVDGRQPGYSEGMSLPELTAFLESLGAREAINLDGGGSSIMVARGIPLSRPSDAAGERPVANALAVVRDRSFCRVRRRS